jgi:hypothetical protein
VIFVSAERSAPTKDFLVHRWTQMRTVAKTAPDLTEPIRLRWDREIPTDDVPTLTDDYAPTDALLLLFD